MKEGEFSLRDWNSNCQSFRERIKRDEEKKNQLTVVAPPNGKDSAQNHSEEESSSVEATKLQIEQFVKIFGIYWDVIRHEFEYDLSELIEYAECLPVTKRSALQLFAKIFNPIVRLTPFTITMKILFQSLCIEKVNLDESLEGEALIKWKSFVNDLNIPQNIRVPRCYANRPTTGSAMCLYPIHGFSNASERAQAAVVYLRTKFSNGETDVNIVTSKTRVARSNHSQFPGWNC